MASSWKKIFDKIDETSPGGPFASDWEAMNKKIEAQPSLNSSSKKGGLWLRAGLGIVLLALIALGTFTFWPQQVEKPAVIENTTSPSPSQISERNNSTTENSVGADPMISADNATKIQTKQSTLSEGKENVVATTPVEVPVSDNSIISNTPDEAATEPAFYGNEAGEARKAITTKEGSKHEFTPGEFFTEANSLGEAENVTGNDADTGTNKLMTTKESLGKEELVKESTELADFSNPASMDQMTVMEKVELARRDISFAVEELHLLNTEAEEDKLEIYDLQSSASTEASHLRHSGLRITALNAGALFFTDYSSDVYGIGGGLDIDIQRKGLLLNTGLHYYQLNNTNRFERTQMKTLVDTSYSYQIDIRTETTVDSTWIVRGPWQGGYVYDTTRQTIIDTVTLTSVDSTSIKLKIREEQKIRLSYVGIPILAGHRFRLNRFAIDVMGGVTLHQLTLGNTEGFQVESRFGVDVVVQPALRYYFLPEWSVYGKAALRYSLTENDYRPQNLYNGFQLGLTFHW